MSVLATCTNVAASATNVTILISNSARLAARFYNESDSRLRLKFGATASTSSFTVIIEAGGFYEMGEPAYKSRVDAIWENATPSGFLRVTEEQ